MAEVAEGGATLAWRLLATLEGGSLILATSALLAYTVRHRIRRRRRNETREPVRSVLITSSSSQLGMELKRQFESHGCAVSSVTEEATSGAGSELEASTEGEGRKVDALIVVGAEPQPGLEGITRLVSEDVYDNLKILNTLKHRVRRGGYLSWACAGAGATSGAFAGAAAAFDAALAASLQHVAKTSHCEPVWVGRCESAPQAAQRVVAALMPREDTSTRFYIRNAAYKVTGCIGRWLKIVT